MRYKYAIFDLDGTLMDTLPDICDSVNYALAEFSMPAITLEQCRQYVGNATHHLIKCSVPENTDEETVNAVMNCYLPYYNRHCNIKTKPYEGIPKLLDFLKNKDYKLALVSNKPDTAAKKLADEYFPGVFEAVIGQQYGIARKPSPDTIFEAMRIMNAEFEDCVYIGDSEVDIITAQNAGIPCISVTWGFRTETELHKNGAMILINSPKELENILL